MTVDLESIGECADVLFKAYQHLRYEGGRRGHDVDSCACNLCRGCKLARESWRHANAEYVQERQASKY